MADSPNYVRLREGVTALADIGASGWSITGNDVQPFPKDNAVASEFVTAKLREGVLEPCSKSEYEEVQEGNATELPDSESHQESSIQDNAKAVAAARVAKKNGGDKDEKADAKSK